MFRFGIFLMLLSITQCSWTFKDTCPNQHQVDLVDQLESLIKQRDRYYANLDKQEKSKEADFYDCARNAFNRNTIETLNYRQVRDLIRFDLEELIPAKEATFSSLKTKYKDYFKWKEKAENLELEYKNFKNNYPEKEAFNRNPNKEKNTAERNRLAIASQEASKKYQNILRSLTIVDKIKIADLSEVLCHEIFDKIEFKSCPDFIAK